MSPNHGKRRVYLPRLTVRYPTRKQYTGWKLSWLRNCHTIAETFDSVPTACRACKDKDACEEASLTAVACEWVAVRHRSPAADLGAVTLRRGRPASRIWCAWVAARVPPRPCVWFPAHRGRRALRKTYADIFARHTRSGHGWSPARPERPCEPECGASAIHRQSCRVTRQLRRSMKQRTPRQFAQKIPPATINSIVDAVGRKAGGLIQSPRRRLQFCFTSSLLS